MESKAPAGPGRREPGWGAMAVAVGCFEDSVEATGRGNTLRVTYLMELAANYRLGVKVALKRRAGVF